MLDLIISVLLAVAAVFSLIELGISAHLVSLVDSRYYRSSTLDYLVFCSLWSLFVTLFLLIWAFLSRSRNNSERWTALLTLALNGITMIFWLAGFASLADAYDGYNPRGEPGAQLAFAVILWLIFLALLVLNFLTAFGVYKSERVGHSRIFDKTKFDSNRGPTTTATTTTSV